MNSCPQCGESVEAGGRFCQECGTQFTQGNAPDTPAPESFLGRVERRLYFRIARGYAWGILLFASIGLAVSLFLLIPVASSLWLGNSTAVSAGEIRQTGASGESERRKKERENLDPARWGKLQAIIMEIFKLLPEEVEQERWGGGKVRVKLEFKTVRERLENYVSHFQTIEGQMAVLEELKGILKGFPEHERLNAVEKFFEIKAQKEQAVEAKRAAARAELGWQFSAIVAAITIITLGSMILVLLAIERNLRAAPRRV